MDQFWKEVRMAGIMGLIVPGIVLGIAVALFYPDKEVNIHLFETEAVAEIESTPQERVSIPVLTNGEISEMDLDEYLTGVVLAEMPASFEEEALKAQAVVARTYAVRAWEKGNKHTGAAVCTDSTCCQGYISEADYLSEGGTQESVGKIRNAVEATKDKVVTYDGELIEATYFSCSGGSTEDAVAVWGTEVPYLQSVQSPGEEKADHYVDSVSFSGEEFTAALGVKLEGDPSGWMGAVQYTDGGGVDSMVIGGVTFKGTTLRSLLGLRSTAFSVSVSADTITITTRGFGHRVGMSQYGADAMAAGGSTYAEILAYYYHGTDLVDWVN